MNERNSTKMLKIPDDTSSNADIFSRHGTEIVRIGGRDDDEGLSRGSTQIIRQPT
jgi:hypothetical protein